MAKHRFPKMEKLKSGKLITRVFNEGKSVFSYPLRLVYLPLPYEKDVPALRATVSVSKRKFPRAVDRNLLKRRMREAWRLHKHPYLELLAQRQCAFALVWVYHSDEILDYQRIAMAVRKLLERVGKEQ